MNIEWKLYPFNDLTIHQLYEILRLRQEVFAVEQNCAYQDCDHKDEQAFHLCGYLNHELIAVARILPPDYAYSGCSSLGRICNKQSHRGNGLGKELMDQCLIALKSKYSGWPCRIAAQTYLLPFYKNFGFIKTDVAYYEDGIHHTEMLLEKLP